MNNNNKLIKLLTITLLIITTNCMASDHGSYDAHSGQYSYIEPHINNSFMHPATLALNDREITNTKKIIRRFQINEELEYLKKAGSLERIMTIYLWGHCFSCAKEEQDKFIEAIGEFKNTEINPRRHLQRSIENYSDAITNYNSYYTFHHENECTADHSQRSEIYRISQRRDTYKIPETLLYLKRASLYIQQHRLLDSQPTEPNIKNLAGSILGAAWSDFGYAGHPRPYRRSRVEPINPDHEYLLIQLQDRTIPLETTSLITHNVLLEQWLSEEDLIPKSELRKMQIELDNIKEQLALIPKSEAKRSREDDDNSAAKRPKNETPHN